MINSFGGDIQDQYQNKKIMDSNLEKVVYEGEFMYFVPKDGKDKPLD